MNEKILVLDDEPGITLLCARLLKRAGYDATAFTEVTPAYEHLRTNSVDLLLVDIRMPEVDGFAVISQVKQLQPDIAVLVMTGFGTVETAIQALRQGVDGLLLKPFEQGSELVDAVKQALIDSEKKRDAARIQALRPLFNVTESLLSETRPDRLMELIKTAIQGHLRCSHVGYYQVEDGQKLSLLTSDSLVLDPVHNKSDATLLKRIVKLDSPLLVNMSGPGSKEFRALLQRRGLGAAMFVPVMRLNVNSLLFAGRSQDEPSFREADLETFLILSNQAATALENARLYAELREYVKQVEESQRALLQAEKMAAAGRLSASIAHEINNPLQSVQNCLHLAGREDLPEEQRSEYFELAKTELNRLMSTVQRMLDFYRPGAITPDKVDLRSILQHVINLMAKQFEKEEILVQIDVPENLPAVVAVGSQIQQVLINLLLNSLDAMPAGGEIQIRANSVKGGVEILVQDNGPGIPDERLPHVFEPFFSTKEGGTGLGLTVSYNIVTAHGGTLELVSNNRPGACFRVYLPIGGK
ncbi:MAG: response regulator [Anaerolineales bacterium]|nr:response regulator [Anaerolineales bacterium]